MKNQRKIGPPLSKSILAEEFLDFLIGLGEFVLTEFHQGFGTFQLLGELINIEFIILHSVYNFFKLSYGLFVFHFFFFHFFIFVLELTVDILKLLPLQGDKIASFITQGDALG
jgi:hypothetical protein